MKLELELELLLKLLDGVIFIRARCEKSFQCHITRRDIASNPPVLKNLQRHKGRRFICWFRRGVKVEC
jgi:hypothetical protein